MLKSKKIAPLLFLSLVWVGGHVSPAMGAEKPLTFAVDGVVERVMVKPGMSVQQGASLAKLDQTLFYAALKQAQIGHKSAKLAADYAQEAWQRAQKLYDDLNASKQELEEAELALAEAQARQAHAQWVLSQAQWRLQRSQLLAPVSGRITAVPGYAGQVIHNQSGPSAVILLETP
ncbi:efflux RND transporter periplasmic adaptor subunit [Magnetococcus sp. PR-3]|uniref:efflux RND transporter periplasmic adaptor subunit n=1 Tax=Magnetococcus sp. PR-3 TaxID=3120355 RepID=UPI002FCE3995